MTALDVYADGHMAIEFPMVDTINGWTVVTTVESALPFGRFRFATTMIDGDVERDVTVTTEEARARYEHNVAVESVTR